MDEIAKFGAKKKEVQILLSSDIDGAEQQASVACPSNGRGLIGASRYRDRNPQALVEGLRKLNGDVSTDGEGGESLYDKLMDLEMAQVEAYAETIAHFDSNYDHLSKQTQETSAAFFSKLRDMETAYHERVSAAASELLEKAAGSDGEGMADDVKMLLSDKETLSNALAGAHDHRVAQLDGKEDSLRVEEEKAANAILERVKDAEYVRNRSRVVEIWNLVHKIHKEELDRMAEAADV